MSNKYEEITVKLIILQISIFNKDLIQQESMLNYQVVNYQLHQGKPFVIYPSGKAKKVGFLRNPKVYPGCEVFVPFEEKTPFPR